MACPLLNTAVYKKKRRRELLIDYFVYRNLRKRRLSQFQGKPALSLVSCEEYFKGVSKVHYANALTVILSVKASLRSPYLLTA